MLGRAGKFLVIITLVLTTGCQWAALQSIAWTMMLANNMRSQSLALAVTHTFDGLHPCCLCKAIAQAKKAEEKSESAPPVTRLEYVPFASQVSIPQPLRPTFPPLIKASFASVSEPPPLPPPRPLQVG
jgi:hypothetical protein